MSSILLTALAATLAPGLAEPPVRPERRSPDDAKVVAMLRAADPHDYKPLPGPFRVETIDQLWRDTARGRDVPVRIDRPATAPVRDKLPVVVFSHGGGGSREGYAYLAGHLASHGYLVIRPQHAGSDAAALDAARVEHRDELRGAVRERIRQRLRNLAGRGPDDGPVEPPAQPRDDRDPLQRAISDAIQPMISDPANLENRPRDVSFVLDELTRRPEWYAVADLSRVGVAGHSFGAYTALAVAGLSVDTAAGPAQSWPDPRVKAAVAMSPQGTGNGMGITEQSWGRINVPVLALSGTQDTGDRGQPPAWRAELLAHIKSPTWFVTITEANHMTFAAGPGHPNDSRALRAAASAPHAKIILMTTTAFLDAFVKGEQAGEVWLRQDAKAKLEGAASVQSRNAER